MGVGAGLSLAACVGVGVRVSVGMVLGACVGVGISMVCMRVGEVMCVTCCGLIDQCVCEIMLPM